MIVRPTEFNDLPRIVELARLNVSESRFGFLPFDPERVMNKVQQMVKLPRTDHFFSSAVQSDGTLVGYMVGSIEEYFFCDRTVATSVFLFVDPAHRGGLAALKLILAFRAWAKNRGATEMYIGVAGGVLMQRTGAFLQRIGLKPTGGNYSVWLQPPEQTKHNL